MPVEARPVETRPVDSRPVETAEPPGAAPGKALSPAARRALEEAAARRAAIDARAAEIAAQPETAGRGGLEPVRYADWEIKGIACDFS
ncbi:DUF1674 domain-containing protein [Salinarimonas chemoclinalis]|uniref:DUF1674 domain-containing protein n=1 Tax=Salinarimonas chemoclinalis TaxID=3241599 RepID=UPI003558DB57